MNTLGILQTSACTGVGLTGPAVSAAIRGAISAFSEWNRSTDRLGAPVIVSAPPGVGEHDRPEDAIAAMAVAALDPLARAADLPVFLALPERRPGLEQSVASRVSDALAERFQGLTVVWFSESGHAAGGAALSEAADYLMRRGGGVAAVIGVDSYLSPETIAWLEANRQLHAPYNAWGFIPGAAAGGCLVCLADSAIAKRHPPRAVVEAIAMAQEEAPIKTEGVCLGKALSSIVESLAEGYAGVPVFDDLYCDLNGEAYRSDELGFVMCRDSRRFRDPASFVAPADCWGDVGAASLPLFVTLAIETAARGFAAGPVSLHLAGSESGLRAGLRLRCVTGGR